MPDDMTPIATIYNGIRHRSRLEANVAQMLHQLGIVYEYEPSSYLLDDGTHYRPDFWCPEIRLWVEVRGYSNQKGDRQIRQFGDAIMAGRLRADKMMMADEVPGFLRACGHPRPDDCPIECDGQDADWRGDRAVDYLVLSPGDDSRFFEFPSPHTCEGRDTEVIVCRCKCGKAYFASRHNDWRCRVCGASDKLYHLGDWARAYLDEFGRPTVLHESYDRGRRKLLRVELSLSVWVALAGTTP